MESTKRTNSGISKILKFGGTSVGSPDVIKQVATILSNHHQHEHESQPISSKDEMNFAVVFSAFGGTTDKLLQMSYAAAKGDEPTYSSFYTQIEDRHLQAVQQLFETEQRQKEISNKVKEIFIELNNIIRGVYLLREASLRTLDLVMSFGERLSAFIVSEALKDKLSKWKVAFLDSRTVIKTDSNFGNATVDFEKTNANIQNYFKEHADTLQVITGFIGSDHQGDTTTLGRGGSDYSASIFGAALKVDEIQIWTDVDGILSADPRKVPEAIQITSMSYEEAMEMSYFGAKVLQLSTMGPALINNIPIHIKNTFNPSGKGTLIIRNPERTSVPIRGITSIDKIALLNLQGCGMVGVVGISQRLFRALASEGVNVMLITQASSEHSICVAVDPSKAQRAKEVVEKEFELEIIKDQIDGVFLQYDLAIVAAVGESMRGKPGIAGKIFSTLGRENIDVVAIAQGSSERNISCVINNTDISGAVKAIHEAFFNPHKVRINVAVAGLGLIGSELLNQIAEQSADLMRDHSVDLRVVAICNSQKSLLDKNGIDLSNWRSRFDQDAQIMNGFEKFGVDLSDLHLSHSVFVDCTSSPIVANSYVQLLNIGLHIVTANKKANSSSYENYLAIRGAARSNRCQFKYETNVGAGLPVMSTLKSLLLTGDKVERIEAILSGTLSFVFNSFNGNGKTFSDIVKEAKQLGLTEPDPRDDLSGMDVARKALILARECGSKLELDDIVVENLVPTSCQSAATVDEFFQLLKQEDTTFEEKRKNSSQQGQVLRYVASIDLKTNSAKVSLAAVDNAHPCASVTNRDNIIVFRTKRYCDTPLVVKGPGAGAAVTAGGLFADIISIFHL